MDIEDASHIGTHEKRRQDPHKPCQHDECDSVRMQLFKQGTLKVLALGVRFAHNGDGRDAMFPRTRERIGIRLVRQDDGNLRTDIPALHGVDDGRKVRAASRAEHADFFLRHQRHRP